MAFTKRPQVSMSGRTVGFWEWLPDNYASLDNLPCIIALHGLGETGDGSSGALNSLLNTGVPALINGSGFPYDAVVICPQYSGSTIGLYDFNALFDYVLANYDVDPNKIALTGYSAGANSIIEMLAESTNSNRVSCFVNCDTVYAYVPSIATTMNNGGLKSYWFQDTTDTTFGQPTYTQVQSWVAGCNNATGVYRTGAGHGFWNTVYSYSYYVTGTTDVFEWMISQSRASVTLDHTLFYQNAGTMYRLLLYSDNSWTQQQYISGSWTSVSKQTFQIRWKIGSTLYRASMTGTNYTMI